jgi:gluconolactonase
MKKFYYLVLLFVPFITLSQSPVPSTAKIEKLATGFKQPEGPVWIDSLGILFSDIQGNKIYRWSPVDSTLTDYLKPSDSSNGLTLDRQGRLILTQMAKRRVSRQETNGTITPLVSTYHGKKFNSPNDVVVKSDGSIIFTDPDFNTPLGQTKEMGFKGIFRISPTGIISVIDTTFDKPNGICFSPDETKLYVNESPLGKIYAWDIVNDSTLQNKKLFYTIPLGGYADGMKVDPDGNIFCTGPKGIWVISPSGVCLDTILMPGNASASNCNWGDADRKSLYITSGSSLYRIRLGPTTGVKDHGSQSPKTFELYGNYPNPFNPATTIYFQLPCESHVALNIYDIQGRKIDTLIDNIMQSGYHHVQFNPKNISTGIYLCCLTAESRERGNYSVTKKMVVLK